MEAGKQNIVDNCQGPAPAQPVRRAKLVPGARGQNIPLIIFLAILSVVVLVPLFFILMNSFKANLYVTQHPFSLPTGRYFVGFQNYIAGLTRQNMLSAVWWSFFITILSTALIIFFTSMTAYWLARVKSIWSTILYYMFVFSMIVPFQMVMFTMTDLAARAHLNSPWGLSFLYLGFGAGLSVFMFTGFVKSIPLEIEEAAMIDGCNPLQSYFRVVFPILKPTAITVTILNVMWIWNDFLLPYLILGISTNFRTIPVVIQMTMQGSYGSVDYGAFMAMLVLSIIPIVIFFLSMQKHIIEGIVAGAVKG